MTQLRRPTITVKYNDKDITADVSKYLTDFSYTDKEHGASDELALSMEDKQLKWQNEWYPDKSARLEVEFGYIGRVVSAGKFQINSFDLSGPPDVAKIGGLATGITKNVRTKKSSAHENQTLSQIANTIAQANGFTVSGDIADINIKRATQDEETDLRFLKRLAENYGYVFSLRDTVITFHDVYDLEGVEPVVTIDKTECADYNFRNQITGSYSKAHVKHTKSTSKYAIEATAELSTLPANAQQQTNSVDALEIRTRAEDELQASHKAKAHLHKHNKKIAEVDLDVDGNPYLVAGNNVEVTGFGELSGTYHITESKHTITKSDGYRTKFTAHKVKTPAAGTKRPKKTVTVPATRPGYVPIYDFSSLNG